MLSISCARAVPMLLLITSSIHLAASSRGEASLIESDTVRGPEADVPKHCEEAVQHSHSASETIKALQACIEDLERHSSQSNAAHSKAKQTSQAYANDVNMLGSFVQSLKATLNKTYEKHKLQYTSLREDHQQVVSGLIQKLATLEALEGKERAHQHAGAGVTSASHGHSNRKLQRMHQTKSSLHQAGQTSSVKSKKLEEALRKVAQRKQRRPRARRQVPSLLQLSAQNGEDPLRNEGDWSQDEEIELNRRSGQNPTSLMQLAATAAAESLVDAVEAQAPAHSPASLLEQEMSSLADLFWKPLTGGKPTLQTIVGVGFTKDDVEASAAVNGDGLKQSHIEEKVQ